MILFYNIPLWFICKKQFHCKTSFLLLPSPSLFLLFIEMKCLNEIISVFSISGSGDYWLTKQYGWEYLSIDCCTSKIFFFCLQINLEKVSSSPLLFFWFLHWIKGIIPFTASCFFLYFLVLFLSLMYLSEIGLLKYCLSMSIQKIKNKQNKNK